MMIVAAGPAERGLGMMDRRVRSPVSEQRMRQTFSRSSSSPHRRKHSQDARVRPVSVKQSTKRLPSRRQSQNLGRPLGNSRKSKARVVKRLE